MDCLRQLTPQARRPPAFSSRPLPPPADECSSCAPVSQVCPSLVPPVASVRAPFARYVVTLAPVNLAEFVSELTSGRPVLVDFPRLTVLIDPTLCSLILDNALSNASKHGHPQSPDVRLTIGCPANPLGPSRFLRITVSNAANPDRPSITPEYVEEVLSGAAQRSALTSAMSDQIGLQHTFLAAETLGVRPSLKQDRQQVVFEMCIETEIAPVPDVQQDHLRDSLLAQFPGDLQVYCLDDSEPTRRLLHHNLVRWANTQCVHALGSDQSEVWCLLWDVPCLWDDVPLLCGPLCWP